MKALWDAYRSWVMLTFGAHVLFLIAAYLWIRRNGHAC